MTLEEAILSQVSLSLPFFTKTVNGYKFQCPYCQHGCVDKKGKPYSVGKVKGSLYLKNNSLKGTSKNPRWLELTTSPAIITTSD